MRSCRCENKLPTQGDVPRLCAGWLAHYKQLDKYLIVLGYHGSTDQEGTRHFTLLLNIPGRAFAAITCRQTNKRFQAVCFVDAYPCRFLPQLRIVAHWCLRFLSYAMIWHGHEYWLPRASETCAGRGQQHYGVRRALVDDPPKQLFTVGHESRRLQNGPGFLSRKETLQAISYHGHVKQVLIETFYVSEVVDCILK